MWTDAHCHIPYNGVDEAVIAHAADAGVTRLISVGTDLAQSIAAIEVADRHAGVWATAGVHPHDASGGIEGIEALLSHPRVVGVGECGLDYHYEHSPREAQREVFAAQIALAHRHGLALVIHTREAWDDTFALLEAETMPERTVFHCFTGGPAEARRALDIGAMLSFSGIVTFKGAADVREAAALCPLDHFTVETDTPYLAPVPHRGRTNTPAWVPLVGEAVAGAMGVAVQVVEEASTANAARLFDLT
ncbi:MAG: TatD family hydrolase [Actinobacteria bacterium]|nr:TatD family hydrolase [Actinomycetota bacterium]